MSGLGSKPGDTKSEPIESRRTTADEADTSVPAGSEAEEASSVDLPQMGEFSAESARMTPLDEIAEAERENMPRD